MRFKRFLPKILLTLGFLALFLIIKYQAFLKDIGQLNLEKIKIYCENFFYAPTSEPRRHPPISFLERETELKVYVGEPFINFTDKDWNGFWNLIYGAFPKENPKTQGLPKKMRRLTLDEIAFELMQRYPQPFAYFKENHWKLLFDIILKR